MTRVAGGPWRRLSLCLGAVWLGLSVCADHADAQTGTSDDLYPISRASSEITIDGVVGDDEWRGALTLELEYEITPGENTEPPVRTVVFMTYDEHRVLVAFRAYDPDPSSIRARYRDRDSTMGDDNVAVILDTFNDERRAYEFWVNPLGAQLDAIYNDVQKNFDRSWDAIWHSAGRLTEFGYEVELAVPFNQIRFQPTRGPQIWGLDLTRTWPRSDHVRIGLFPRERGANSYLAQEKKIVGFEGVSAGRNLEFVPTLTGFALQERPDFPDSVALEEQTSLELGATMRWGVTPNLTLTAAANPDFSQIEADAVQLAINERFALFFEEKRPFFLESADYFETGLDLLYTRIIADPSAAIKLTGKFGRHTVGLFSALDDVTNLVVPGVEGSDSGSFETKNASTVGRYRYDLGEDSTVGVMFTDREGKNGYFNRVFNIDARLRPTDSDSVTVDAAWSSTRYSSEMQTELDLTGEEISDQAVSAEYLHTTRNWFGFVEYRDFGDLFRADLGFIPRVGFKGGNAGAGYIWWGAEDTWYNRLEVGGFAARNRDQEGDLLSQRQLMWFEGQGPLQSNFHIEFGRLTEVYEGVRFENMKVSEFNIRMRPSSFFRLHVFAIAGEWVDFDNVQPADRLRIRGEVEFNIGRHFGLELEYLHSSLDVEGGRLYQARVPQMAAIWQFNTRTFVRAILQYTDVRRDPELYSEEVDAQNRDFFVQLLFSYKVNPQTVAFFGYSEGRAQTEDISMTTTGRSIFAKIGYAWIW